LKTADIYSNTSCVRERVKNCRFRTLDPFPNLA
jgi:hypothetical protein